MTRKRSPSEDENALWDHVTRDVRRLHPASPISEPDKPDTVSAMKRNQPIRSRKMIEEKPVDTKRDPELIHGLMPGVDRRSNQRLRRGQTEIDGKIDLHGMTQTEAFQALMGFLEHSRRIGRRCVLVITGKGLRESGEIGVLRRQVPKWLNDNARHMIQGFDYAHRRHGGEGALYVLLRKPRR
jgi:DNA-nicking Smr family endonuclease